MIERVVAKDFFNYLNVNDLMPVCQSGYRHLHSTETALLQVLSDLFAATDDHKTSLLAFLDMSAAFDCVDHDILLKRLSCSFGITGTVLLWFESYLHKRSHQVLFNNDLSNVKTMVSGVP